MPVTDFVTVLWSPTDTPLDATPTFVDISDQVQKIRISYGRDDELDVYASGTAKLDINNGDTAGHTKIFDLDTWYRRRRIRVPGLFDGFIRDVGHDLTKSPDKASARLECDDLFGLTADAELTGDWHDIYDPLIDNDVYQPHTTPDGVDGVIARTGVMPYMLNVFDKLGLPLPSITVTDLGHAQTIPIFVPFEQTGNAWAILQKYLEAEGSWIAVAHDLDAYNLIYGGRWHPFEYGSTDPSFIVTTFSDTPGAGELGYLKDSVEWSSPASTYANSVVCQSVDGEPQLAEDIPTGWPRDSLPTRDAMPIINENWINASANLLLAIRKQTNTYPRQIKYVQWAEGLNSGPIVQLGDLHQVKVTFPGGTQTTYLVFVESVIHEIDHEKWTTTLGYTSADRWLDAFPDGFFPNVGLFTLDDPARGLDSGSILAP